MRKERPPILWPAWRYGPDREKELFDSPEDVPKGWKEKPWFKPRGGNIGFFVDDLPGVSDDELKSRLTKKKIPYNPKWFRKKLLHLLKENE